MPSLYSLGMVQGNIPAAGNEETPPFFAARLFPHRSLSRKGFTVLMLLLGVISLTTGLVFLSIGAWPVFGFLGLDVFLLWLAFRLNYRAGRAFEEVAVWPHDLLVRKVSPSGKVLEHRFNPFWTRFRVDRHDEIGITGMFLAAEGREVDIGSFLNPRDRESFASAFGEALATVKRR
jgi:uncharacterized membrane protein